MFAQASDYIASFSFSSAPLSSIYAPLTASCIYVTVVLALSWYMRAVRGGRGMEGGAMRALQAAHNLVLCVGSLVMMVGTLREVVLRALREPPDSGVFGGATFLFCEPPSTRPNGALWFWSYVYYLSKYYELLDTVLQLLKGRPPPHFFLHVYHHAVVLFMAWSWLEYTQTLQFIGLLFNTSVHVVMYYYYFRSVLKLPTPWKAFVTQFQIVQFGTSLLCYLVTLALLARGANCAGTRVLVFNLVFNVTLLYQFVGVLGKNAARAKKA